MRVRILFFASLRDHAPGGKYKIEVSQPVTSVNFSSRNFRIKILRGVCCHRSGLL